MDLRAFQFRCSRAGSGWPCARRGVALGFGSGAVRCRVRTATKAEQARQLLARLRNPTRMDAMIPAFDRIDHIHLYASNRNKAEQWYADVMGFTRVPAP